MQNINNEKPSKVLTGRLLRSVKFVDVKNIEGKVLLDMGCGYGWFELYFKDKFKKAYACEISEYAISTLKNNVKFSNVIPIIGTALNIPLSSGTVDTVVCWEVIEHIPKNTELTMFNEIKRVLKKGGVFYLSTPFNSLFSNIFDPAWWLIGHRHYSIATLSSFAKDAGFVVEDYKVYGGWWAVMSILNMYISKWVFRRSLLFKTFFNSKESSEYANASGFVNIFVKFRKI